jgi:hypothetical protein
MGRPAFTFEDLDFSGLQICIGIAAHIRRYGKRNLI